MPRKRGMYVTFSYLISSYCKRTKRMSVGYSRLETSVLIMLELLHLDISVRPPTSYGKVPSKTYLLTNKTMDSTKRKTTWCSHESRDKRRKRSMTSAIDVCEWPMGATNK